MMVPVSALSSPTLICVPTAAPEADGSVHVYRTQSLVSAFTQTVSSLYIVIADCVPALAQTDAVYGWPAVVAGAWYTASEAAAVSSSIVSAVVVPSGDVVVLLVMMGEPTAVQLPNS